MFDFRRRPTALWVWMALAAGASAQDASQPLPMDWDRSGACWSTSHIFWMVLPDATGSSAGGGNTW